MAVSGLSESNKRDVSIVLVYLLLAQTLSNVNLDISLKRTPVQQFVRHIQENQLITNIKWPLYFEDEAGILASHSEGKDALTATSSFDTLLDASWNSLSALSFSSLIDSGSDQDEQQISGRISVPSHAPVLAIDSYGPVVVKLPKIIRDLDDFASGRASMLPSAVRVDKLVGIGEAMLEERGALDSKSQRQFEILSPIARALLHAFRPISVSCKHIAAMIEPTRIFLRPLWYEQLSAADFAESNVLIRKADPLMTPAASHFASGSACAPGTFDAACASKTDESILLAGIENWDGEYEISNSDGYNVKPLGYGNYSDANANQLNYDAANRDASPACADGMALPTPGELVDILEDSNENIDPLGTHGASRFGSASNGWQAAAGYREPKDQPQSGEYLVAYEPGAASSSWRARSDQLDYTTEELNYDVDAGEIETVNEEFSTSNDNLLTILTDIEQSVNELNELDGEDEQRRFETAAYAFVGRPVRRASDESGVRSLSNQDEEEQQLEIEFDSDLNVFNEVTPHPEYAEVVGWTNPSYPPYASTSTGYPSLSRLPRQAGLRNTFEETEEEECELEEFEEDVSNADESSLYTVPKSRAQPRASRHMRSRNQPTTSDATESIASWNDQDQSEHSYAHSDTNSRATSSAQLGSHALSNANLPFGDDEIVHSSFARFESMLSDPRLSASDVQTMKDIRRRGKNKIAAMNCRRRKQQRVDTLIDERVELNRQNRALEGRLARLREQARAYDARLERAMRQHQSNGGRAVAVRA